MTATAVVLRNAPSSLDFPRLAPEPFGARGPAVVGHGGRRGAVSAPRPPKRRRNRRGPMRSPPDSWATCSTASPAKPASPSRPLRRRPVATAPRGCAAVSPCSRASARLLADNPAGSGRPGRRQLRLARGAGKGRRCAEHAGGGGLRPRQQPGSTDGYLATHSQIATKTSKPLLETSQTVSVITREQIDDTASKTVQQAMRYTPGIFTGQVGASNRYDYVVMQWLRRQQRGQHLPRRSQGHGRQRYLQLDAGRPVLPRTHRCAQGPSSVLYGRSLPGGLVALTSKKPLYEDYRQITGSIGNMGPEGDGLRFQRAARRGEAHRLPPDRSRQGLGHPVRSRQGGALRHRPDPGHRLQRRHHPDPARLPATRSQRGYHGGVPADGTLSHHNGRHISREFFDGEPSKDDFDRTQRMFGYQLEHRIDDVWSARQNFRYLTPTSTCRRSTPTAGAPASRTS